MYGAAQKIGGIDYYFTAGGGGVGRDMEGYYTGAVQGGERPGVWGGAFAKDLGLEGEVSADSMRDLFEDGESPAGLDMGQRPSSLGAFRDMKVKIAEWQEANPDALPEELAEAIRAIERGNRVARIGYDLTYSAEKSVTVAWAAVSNAEQEARGRGDLGEAKRYGEIRQAIEDAILSANEEAHEIIERGMVTRAGRHTSSSGHWVKVTGMARASFFQRTSRDLDPQLHIHNVWLNRAMCADGKVRTLDEYYIKHNRQGWSALVDRLVNEKLTAIGLTMHTRADGLGREVEGITDKQREIFSSRRVTITAKLAPLVKQAEERYGRKLSALELDTLKRQVTLDTRRRKTGAVESDEAMLSRWSRQLRDRTGAGLTPVAADIRARYEEAKRNGPAAADEFSIDDVIQRAVAAVSVGRATWRESELRHQINMALPQQGGLGRAGVEELLDRLTAYALAGSHTVEVGGRQLPVPAELYAEGVVGYSRPGDPFYASTETLDGEDLIRRHAVARGRHCVPAEAVDEWLDEHDKYQAIGEDQREAVRRILSTDAAAVRLVGPAGTGKTFALGAGSGAWRDLSGGGKFIALTTSSKAAKVLAENDVEVTANLALWLKAQDRLTAGKGLPTDRQYRLGPRDVVVIDESSMVDRRVVLEVLQRVEAKEARLVYAGDPAQLSAIGAGGVMGLLDDHCETYTLSNVRRFVHQWEADASLRLRAGDATALDEYDRRGRLLEADTLDDAVAMAARGAAADRIAGRSTMIVCGTEDTATAAAVATRAHLIESGLVHPDRGEVDLELEGGQASEGDDIQCRKNDHHLGVLNRARYRVRRVLEGGGLEVVDVERGTGEVKTIPAPYVRQSMSLAYAATAHAIQGDTVNTSHDLFDGRGGSADVYVPMSRGQERNTAYVVVGASQREPSAPQAVDVLAKRDGEQAGVRITEATRGEPRQTARAVLAGMVERQDDNLAARVTQEQEAARLASMDALLANREEVEGRAFRRWLDGELDRMVEDGSLAFSDRVRLGSDQSTGTLAAVLQSKWQSGEDPAMVLREAVGERSLVGARSVAQIIYGRVADMGPLGEPLADERVDLGFSDPVRRHLEIVDERMAERRRELGSALVQDPPAWAVAAFGPVPEDPLARLGWEARAGIVAGHREAVKWDDERRPIEAAPGITSPVKRGSWWQAYSALGRVDADRDEATMSEGQLRVRVEAYRRALRWAPAYADPALKVNEQAAEDARRSAELAPTDSEAARHEKEQADHAAVARDAERQAEVRADWYSATLPVKAAHDRALRELVEVREVPVGREPDRTTAVEWLDEQRKADLAEDPHRDITEPDVVDEARDAALAEGVEDRADEQVAVVQVPRPREVDGAEQEQMPERPSPAEMEAITRQAAAVLEKLADQASQVETADYDAPPEDAVRHDAVAERVRE